MSISLRCTVVLLTAVVIVGCDHDVERTTGPSAPTSSPPKSDVVTDLVATPSVSAGMLFACGLRKEGTVVCWGRDTHDYWYAPYGVPAPGGVFAQIDGTYQTACGVSPAGQISCWGRGHRSQMNPPAPAAGLTYQQVSVGPYTSCGLLSNGGVTCWGSDEFGLPDEFGLLKPPADAFTQVSVGYTHACGLRGDGTLACWGTGDFGMVTNAPAPPAGRHFVQVAAGGVYSCVLVDDGSIQCWGDNTQGQLNVPALPAGVTYTRVSVSNEGTREPARPELSCALRSDGQVVCWGTNNYGQRNVPFLPAGMTYTSVSTSEVNGCAARSDGAVVCWGITTLEMTNVPPTLNLVKHPQTIVFTPAVPNPAVPGSTFEPVPNGGSGTPAVLNALTPSVCTTDGTTLTFAAEGSCSFTADRAGNAEYEDAPQLTVTVTVAMGNQSITFTSTPPSPAEFSLWYAVSADGGASGNPVTFSSLTAATCTVDGNTVSFVGLGDCTVAADQAGNASYNAAAQVTQTITVGRRSQAIKFTTSPPSQASVGDSYSVRATVGANGNVVAIAAGPAAVCTSTSGTVAFVGAGTCTVTATQDGNEYYAPATPLTQTITVVRRPQTISFSLPAEGVMGTPLTVSATGGASGNPVTFAVLTPGTCALSGNSLSLTSIGDCTVAADQAANTGYDAAPRVTATVAVRWPFTGFVGLLAPPSVNGPIKPGSTVTLTFSLGGNRGTSVVASATVEPYGCTTPPAPGSGSPISGTLSYTTTTAQYSYRYNTLRTRLPNSCIQLTLRLADGTVRTSLFKFK